MSNANLSILARQDPSRIVYEPFPYLHSEEALEPALYQELADAYPSLAQLVGDKAAENNRLFNVSAHKVVDDPAYPEIWRAFFAYHCSQAYLDEVKAFWGRGIEQEYPELASWIGKPLSGLTCARRSAGKAKSDANRAADVMLDTQFAVNTPVVEPNSVRVPHLDNPWKLFASLVYFRMPGDESTGGDLVLYRLRGSRFHHDAQMNVPERFLEPIHTVPYQANTLIMWVNTERSFHGVTPRSVTPLPRRYINFVGECYNLTTGGFFPKRRTLAGQSLSAMRRLVGARDL
ncbi:MAG: hypothetical protein U1E53_21330 [Dongiaceae bacterium]